MPGQKFIDGGLQFQETLSIFFPFITIYFASRLVQTIQMLKIPTFTTISL